MSSRAPAQRGVAIPYGLRPFQRDCFVVDTPRNDICCVSESEQLRAVMGASFTGEIVRSVKMSLPVGVLTWRLRIQPENYFFFMWFFRNQYQTYHFLEQSNVLIKFGT